MAYRDGSAGGLLTAGKTIGHGPYRTTLQPPAGGFGYHDLLLDLSGPPHANDGLPAGESAT